MQMNRFSVITLGAIAFTAALARADAPTVEVTRKPPPPQSTIHATINDSAATDLAEFLSRRAGLRQDDVEGRLSLARWAREREMFSQATDMAREALYRDPENRAAWLILQQIDQAISLPAEPENEEKLKAE